MSHYTVQLRWIVEQELINAGVANTESNWPVTYAKLGLDDYPIFEEAHRTILNNNIIRHYYMYEIGAETVGLFRLFIRDAMHMIMPYYNQMYESLVVAKEIQPLVDHMRQITEDASGTASNTSTSEASANSTGQDIFSDTPQSALNFENIKSGNYATTADFNDVSSSDMGKSDSSGTYANKLARTETGHDKAESELLLIWRDTFVNIDRDIIEDKELRDCFMMLYDI